MLPSAYVAETVAWYEEHADCHLQRCSDGQPCPAPPELPHWEHCPGETLDQMRVVDCAGCGDCEPGSGHRCHVTGEVEWCSPARSGTPIPDGALCVWADYRLLNALSEHID